MFTILALSNMNEIGFKDHRILRREKSNTLKGLAVKYANSATGSKHQRWGDKSKGSKTGLQLSLRLVSVISTSWSKSSLCQFFSCELRNKIISQDFWKAQDQLQCLVWKARPGTLLIRVVFATGWFIQAFFFCICWCMLYFFVSVLTRHELFVVPWDVKLLLTDEFRLKQ